MIGRSMASPEQVLVLGAPDSIRELLELLQAMSAAGSPIDAPCVGGDDQSDSNRALAGRGLACLGTGSPRSDQSTQGLPFWAR